MINLVRFKDLFNVVSEKNTDKDIPLLAASQSYGVVLKKELGFRTTTIDEDNYRNLKIVRPGNFCITLRSFQGGIEYSNVYGGISSAYTILEPNKIKCNNKYYKYYLKNSHFILMLNRFKISIRDGQNIPFKSISKVLLHNPSLDMQNKIVIFLDNFIERVDYCLEKYRKKIELLKEYKESLIYETVTKGLDADVEMKDSGVDWIGEIPIDWKVERFKNHYINFGGGNYGFDIEDKSGNHILPCFSISDFKNGNLNKESALLIKAQRSYAKEGILKKGILLIEKSGGGEKTPVGRMVVVEEDVKGYYTNFVQAIKVRKTINPYYIWYVLKSLYNLRLHMGYVKQNTGLQNFNFSGFANQLIIPIPSMEKQDEIVFKINETLEEKDAEINNLNKKIALIEELREAIIYEAVTGQLDIDADGAKYLAMIEAL